MAKRSKKSRKSSRQLKRGTNRGKKEEINFEEIIERDEGESPLRKGILIIGEGPTEAAYFLGLCKVNNVEERLSVTVLPKHNSLNNNKGHKGSSVKGLLYMAMEKQKKSKVPYDEIWIVTDNDEENAYKLDWSLDKLKTVVSEDIYNQLISFRIRKMNVRKEEEDKGKHQRILYFLNRKDYYDALNQDINGITDEIINIIIENTSKKNDLELLFNQNIHSWFYDENGNFKTLNDKGEEKFEEDIFDENCFDYIKIAYTSISFEHWLLLHFERNNHPFYNSREIIKYFDEQGYFIKDDLKFKKGWAMYENRDNAIFKDFFKKGTDAINNNIWLNSWQINQTEKIIYEYNPYSTMFSLAHNLLENDKLLNTTFVPLNQKISIENYELKAFIEDENIIIELTYKSSQSKLVRQIYPLFEVKDINGNIINKPKESTSEIIRTNDVIILHLEIQEGNFELPYFIYFYSDYGETIIWSYIE